MPSDGDTSLDMATKDVDEPVPSAFQFVLSPDVGDGAPGQEMFNNPKMMIFAPIDDFLIDDCDCFDEEEQKIAHMQNFLSKCAFLGVSSYLNGPVDGRINNKLMYALKQIERRFALYTGNAKGFKLIKDTKIITRPEDLIKMAVELPVGRIADIKKFFYKPSNNLKKIIGDVYYSGKIDNNINLEIKTIAKMFENKFGKMLNNDISGLTLNTTANDLKQAVDRFFKKSENIKSVYFINNNPVIKTASNNDQGISDKKEDVLHLLDSIKDDSLVKIAMISDNKKYEMKAVDAKIFVKKCKKSYILSKKK